ncbi:hypothetical protein HY449_00675 [Candidatus Pacearchaeota archaeon]|nr:hypothetical protein [Candidatus Pacearchaeota archaeon]
MECCNTKEKEGCCEDKDKSEEMKGGNRKLIVKKKTLLWIAIGILFAGVLYLTFKVNGINANSVQFAATQAASAGSAMVGGC